MEEIIIEDRLTLLKIQNEGNDIQHISKQIDSSFIQFHFCLKGSSIFHFNQGNYAIDLKEDQALLLYNPQRDLPINLELNSKTWLISVLIPIKKFHSLFSSEADYIHFLNEENIDKKYYNNAIITPVMSVVLSQIMNYNLHPSIKPLYLKGKIYELLSLYFNKPEDADIEQCPFLIDEDNVRRIRKAKDIVISRMAEPPSLQELSDEIGLNLKKLKEGFKQVYGDSVYSFLFDYKMEYARKMLETGELNVNEVGLRVGYSTASHFIAAFKKKYGTTPKKYIMSLNT
ncbi:AraC family transcriptional regulator [Galbibacter pacificus]|uniref:AraC family transcriptional regulator n=1 Tax=Galbibacter pacificus TaxID=2996052 RepID=A0ABT6FTY1_9FLAO|nr:AraC family transcriptional regulator [Galbibacter pacificus]MDG3583245.1 AraC family transcriptional regulator [Galbibacter pacificus]MDG3586726.1 AraC family transcriptional regulator [Galbibacter pacificus]